jgi:hypothetical protein
VNAAATILYVFVVAGLIIIGAAVLVVIYQWIVDRD